jgi:hypothetical protein
MKNINKLILILLVFAFQSCSDDYLSPTPASAVSSSSYFTTEAQLETGLINMYDGIQGINSTSSNDNHSIQVEFYLTEMRSDNTKTKSSEGEPEQFENYTVEATNGIVGDYYRSVYNTIYRANVVLDNIGVASAATAGAFEGEAKFVRAYSYFNLVRLFGEVPLVTTVIGPDDIDIQFSRKSTSEVYDLIISDLETAAANLDNSYRTRASKAAAQGLLAKVHLTLGNYGEAKTLCESVMDGTYELEANFKDIFYTEENKEVIFAIGYIPDDAKDSQNFSAEFLNAVGRTTGVNYVTDEAAAALDELGGNRTMFSYRQDQLQPTFNQVVKYLPNGDEDLGIAATSVDATMAGNDWIVLRYADILLMHAEAILGSSPNTFDGSAIASMQLVRNRAGLTDAVTEITQSNLLAERRVELAFENQRLFDLIRFGVAQTVLSDFASNNGFNFTPNDLLLPIPNNEIGLSNGLLTQNPGY